MNFHPDEGQKSLDISAFAKLRSNLSTKFAILEGIKNSYSHKNSDIYLKQKFN